jgi:deazaflavin-dependent oxidoreductase (nitroreductase family)
MPAPRWLARFNRRGTNRVLGPLARFMPGMAIVVHRGRKSGRTYRTPVMVFRWSHGYLVALTYGPTTEWVRNVLAAGGCELEMGGRTRRLFRPRLIHDESRGRVPSLVRVALGFMRVNDFLELTLAG